MKSKERVLSPRSFRLAGIFRGISKPDRMRFLKRKILESSGFVLSFAEINTMRKRFNSNKIDHLPMSESCPCYCCDELARIRHHVIPIKNGGMNKRTNIVPLCDRCHLELHPDMNNKGRRKKREPLIGAIHRSTITQAIVVIPPSSLR